jgi:hypothetical protein
MIPILLCVDIEPNARATKIGERPRWTGYERSHRLLEALRQVLADATGSPAHFNWFLRMDHQVELTYGTRRWAADTYGDLLDEATRQGDEIGLHNHAWRWDENYCGWVIDLQRPVLAGGGDRSQSFGLS